MKHVGMDVGSTTVKAALVDEGEVRWRIEEGQHEQKAKDGGRGLASERSQLDAFLASFGQSTAAPGVQAQSTGGSVITVYTSMTPQVLPTWPPCPGA